MAGRWFRVFYRNGKSEAVLGALEVNRLLERKVPAVLHVELAVIHRCDNCATEAPWGPAWLAYPVWRQIAGDHPDRKEAVKYCSRDCWVAQTGGPDLPHWMNLNDEPDRGRERMAALWRAQWAERDRVAALRNNRNVPYPVFPKERRGYGWCRWCGEAILNQDGTPNRRRTWHPDCGFDYRLHSRTGDQFSFLLERDGPRCQDCGSGQWVRDRSIIHLERGDGTGWLTRDQWNAAYPGVRWWTWEKRWELECLAGAATRLRPSIALEVDHRTPLWSVAHLPDDDRRPYYGPRNLWLLCVPCHKAKTAREAADRAQQKRAL